MVALGRKRRSQATGAIVFTESSLRKNVIPRRLLVAPIGMVGSLVPPGRRGIYSRAEPSGFCSSSQQQCITVYQKSCCVTTVLFSGQSARKNALQVIAEYEGTPAGAVEVPDLSALRELYSEKNPAVPSLRYLLCSEEDVALCVAGICGS